MTRRLSKRYSRWVLFFKRRKIWHKLEKLFNNSNSTGHFNTDQVKSVETRYKTDLDRTSKKLPIHDYRTNLESRRATRIVVKYRMLVKN